VWVRVVSRRKRETTYSLAFCNGDNQLYSQVKQTEREEPFLCYSSASRFQSRLSHVAGDHRRPWVLTVGIKGSLSSAGGEWLQLTRVKSPFDSS
jgi:hypothetical protein